jgi:hypothetical protein
VRVVIKDWDLLDLWEKTIVNLLNVWAGEWTSLADGNCTQ